MTFPISRKRVAPPSPEVTNLIREKLIKQSMSAIARELNLPVHIIKRVRDMAKQTHQVTARRKLRDRREAELYILSKLGKCTDSFADWEKYVNEVLLPNAKEDYKRDTTSPLSKIKVFVPPSERN